MPPIYQAPVFTTQYTQPFYNYQPQATPQTFQTEQVPSSEFTESQPSANLFSELASKIPSTVRNFVNRFIPSNILPTTEQVTPKPVYRQIPQYIPYGQVQTPIYSQPPIPIGVFSPEILRPTQEQFSEFTEPSANLFSDIANKIPSTIRNFVNRFVPSSQPNERIAPTVYQQIPQTSFYGQIPQTSIYGQIPQISTYGQLPQTSFYEQTPQTRPVEITTTTTVATPAFTDFLSNLNPLNLLSNILPASGSQSARLSQFDNSQFASTIQENAVGIDESDVKTSKLGTKRSAKQDDLVKPMIIQPDSSNLKNLKTRSSSSQTVYGETKM